MALDRADDSVEHLPFGAFPSLLRAGDVLILNDSRVIPARLRAIKETTGAKVEMLLVEEVGPNVWWVLLRPGRRVGIGARVRVLDGHQASSAIVAVVEEKNREGHCRVRFEGTDSIVEEIDTLGEVPLPPYIERSPAEIGEDDRERYQTVYAGPKGSVAAPTAGLHFSAPMLAALRRKGVVTGFVTLHVGLGTFAPVKVDDCAKIRLHQERFHLPAETAELIQSARRDGRRVIAVGTTTLRVLEGSAAQDAGGSVSAGRGKTGIFIHPPYRFRVVDGLLTNFHLPGSTLLMLVAAFAAPGTDRGVKRILCAYEEAIRRGYRFFSYGDAMFIRGAP